MSLTNIVPVKPGRTLNGSTVQKLIMPENGNDRRVPSNYNTGEEVAQVLNDMEKSALSRRCQSGEAIDGHQNLNLPSNNRIECRTESCPASDSASSVGEQSQGTKSPRSLSGYPRLNSRGAAKAFNRRMPISALWRKATVKAAITTTKSQAVTKRKDIHRLHPEDNRRFNPRQVAEVVNDVLKKEVDGKLYDSSIASQMTGELTTKIKEEVKGLGYERYKMIAQVLVGSHNGQDVRTVSRCVWNTDTDNYASVSLQNKNMFVVATVYGVYYE